MIQYYKKRYHERWINHVNNLPYEYLNMHALSSSDNITWDTVINNPHLEWDFKKLSKNANISLDIVENNRQCDWDYNSLLLNPSITWNDVIHGRLPFDIDKLSSSPCINDSIFLNNVHLNWDMFSLALNSGITSDSVLQTKYLRWIGTSLAIRLPIYEIKALNMFNNQFIKDMCDNINLTYYDIVNNPQLYWNHSKCIYTGVVYPDDVFIKLIKDGLIGKYDYSTSTNLTWKHIISNKSLPIDMVDLSANPNITTDIIINNQQYEWSADGLSINPNITWEFLEEYPQYLSSELMEHNTTLTFNVNNIGSGADDLLIHRYYNILHKFSYPTKVNYFGRNNWCFNEHRKICKFIRNNIFVELHNILHEHLSTDIIVTIATFICVCHSHNMYCIP
jgi:hypothetical protein